MGTESDGFPDEPTFNLAALAGQEQLQERIRELENRDWPGHHDGCPAKSGGECACDQWGMAPHRAGGLVTVSREDLRAVLRMACDSPEGMPVLPDEDAALLRLTAAVRTGQ